MSCWSYDLWCEQDPAPLTWLHESSCERVGNGYRKMLRDVQAIAMWKVFVYPRFNNSKLIPRSQVAELTWRITSDDLSRVRFSLSFHSAGEQVAICHYIITLHFQTRSFYEHFYSIRDVHRPVLSGEPEKELERQNSPSPSMRSAFDWYSLMVAVLEKCDKEMKKLKLIY